MNIEHLKFWSVVEPDHDSGPEPFFSSRRCDNDKCPHEGHLAGQRYNCVAGDPATKGPVEVTLCEGCMVDHCG